MAGMLVMQRCLKLLRYLDKVSTKCTESQFDLRPATEVPDADAKLSDGVLMTVTALPQAGGEAGRAWSLVVIMIPSTRQF